MVSKQRNIFDKPYKPKPKAKKVVEETIPFEESIFSIKKNKPKVEVVEEPIKELGSEIVENRVFNHDDGISIEDSIFAFNRRKLLKKSNSNGNKVIVHEDNISLEESIFAIKKLPVIDNVVDVVKEEPECIKKRYEDIEAEFLFNKGEIDFEDSIFAKPKKKVYVVPKEIEDKNKELMNRLYIKYKDIYMNEYISNTERLNEIDSNMYDVCCSNLERSKDVEIMNVEVCNLAKSIIRSVCTCAGDVFYSYTNPNFALIDFITEACPDLDVFDISTIIDKSYADVLDGFSVKKNGCVR